MKSNKLTKSELKEDVQKTIGRLRTAINYEYPKERQLALFEKISEDVSKMEIELSHYQPSFPLKILGVTFK